MFRRNPVLIISAIFNLLVPKTIAFGGVATGNINASEAAKVAGIIKSNGFTFIETAVPANTGSNISVVAVFEVSSVKKDINSEINKMIKKGCSTEIAVILSPSHKASPDSAKP